MTVAETDRPDSSGRRTGCSSSRSARRRGTRTASTTTPATPRARAIPTCSCSRTCTPRSSCARCATRSSPRAGASSGFGWQNRHLAVAGDTLTCDGRKVREAGRAGDVRAAGAQRRGRRLRHRHRNGELCLTRPSGCTARWSRSAPSRRRRSGCSSAASSPATCTCRSARRPWRPASATSCAATTTSRRRTAGTATASPRAATPSACSPSCSDARPATAAARRARCTSPTPATGNLGATAIVGGGIAMAAGAALSAQVRGTDRCAVAFFGEGAVAEGSFHEALNLAAVWKLPLVLVCENNGYAELTPVRRAPARAGARARDAPRHPRRAGGRQRRARGPRGRGRGGRTGARRRRAVAAGVRHLPLERPLRRRSRALPLEGGGRGLARARSPPAARGGRRRGARRGDRGRGGRASCRPRPSARSPRP